MAIFFHYKITNFVIASEKYTSWIGKCISSFDKTVGDINIIFVSRQKIIALNKKYLNHNYSTDILSFNYNSGNSIAGDLFICKEQIQINSEIHNTNFDQEVARVIIHGVLHLLGFDDISIEDKKKMRQAEDFYLNELEII